VRLDLRSRLMRRSRALTLGFAPGPFSLAAPGEQILLYMSLARPALASLSLATLSLATPSPAGTPRGHVLLVRAMRCLIDHEASNSHSSLIVNLNSSN